MQKKPSDFKSTRFFDTPLQNCECELVCGNIVVISRENGDEFKPFSINDYQNMCGHNVGLREIDTLDELAHRGLLSKTDGKFCVEPKFFATLSAYMSSEKVKERGFGGDGTNSIYGQQG